MKLDPIVIVAVDLGTGGPNPALAAKLLGIPEGDIDSAFGLLPVEIGSSVYAVRVNTARLQLPLPGVEGPFSDPYIEPAE